MDRPLMAKRVALDNVEHAELRLVDAWTSEASVNQLLLVPSEFEQAQREYPILFRQDEPGRFQAVAILGLDRGENLFLSNGAWNGRYVPSVLRRGPFFLAAGDEPNGADVAIIVDLDDPRVSESEGEPLFLPYGGAAPPLQRAADALRIIDEGLKMSSAMFASFVELGLMVPVEIDVDVGDGTHYRLADLFTIGADQLGALPGPALEKLNRAGFLAAAIHARSSLANMNRLIELKASKLAKSAHG
jgi:hypothetical protein